MHFLTEVGQSTSVIDSMHYNNKTTLCPKNNNAAHINGEVLGSFHGEVKIYINVDKQCEDEEVGHFWVEF
jgi:hypothetical protein